MAAAPVTAGHWEAIEQASELCDELKLFISLGDRKRKGEITIHGESKRQIWDNYLKKYLPENVKFIEAQQPIRAVLDELNANTTDSFVIFSDKDDIEKNFSDESLQKYAPEAFNRITKHGFDRQDTVNISGTKMRQMLSDGKKDLFLSYLPHPLSTQERVEIFNLLYKASVNQHALLEAFTNKPGVNKHLTHIEDLVIDEGNAGVTKAIAYINKLIATFESNTQQPADITVKIDGAPACTFGKDPANGQLFVGTKSIFNANPKVNYTIEDIKRNHPDSPGLQDKLIIALQEFSKINFPDRVFFQGDFLYDINDVKKAKIEGTNYLVFKPNTITYAVPETDEGLYDRIMDSMMGIVVHTYYTPKDDSESTIANYKANFGAKLSMFPFLRSNPEIWITDPTVKISPKSNMNKEFLKKLHVKMEKLEMLNSKVNINNFLSNDIFKVSLNTFFNHLIKTDTQVDYADFDEMFDLYVDYIKDLLVKNLGTYKTEAKRAEKFEIYNNYLRMLYNYESHLEYIFFARNLITTIKEFFIEALNKSSEIGTFVQDGSGQYRKTGAEGFVIMGQDGGAAKLVDRQEFSKLNFTQPKTWGKDTN